MLISDFTTTAFAHTYISFVEQSEKIVKMFSFFTELITNVARFLSPVCDGSFVNFTGCIT